MFNVPEQIIWALEGFNSSFIKVVCSPKNINIIKEHFENYFHVKWNDAYQMLAKEFKTDINEGVSTGYFPLSIENSYPDKYTIEDDGFFIQLSPLYIQYCFGDFCEINLCCEALDMSLEELKECFPNIEYYGCISFPWSDRRCGDSECYDVFTVPEYEKTAKYFCKILSNAILGRSYQGDVIYDLDDEFSFISKLWEELVCSDIEDWNLVISFFKKNLPYISHESIALLIEKFEENIEKEDIDEFDIDEDEKEDIKKKLFDLKEEI